MWGPSRAMAHDPRARDAGPGAPAPKTAFPRTPHERPARAVQCALVLRVRDALRGACVVWCSCAQLTARRAQDASQHRPTPHQPHTTHHTPHTPHQPHTTHHTPHTTHTTHHTHHTPHTTHHTPHTTHHTNHTHTHTTHHTPHTTQTTNHTPHTICHTHTHRRRRLCVSNCPCSQRMHKIQPHACASKAFGTRPVVALIHAQHIHGFVRLIGYSIHQDSGFRIMSSRYHKLIT